LLPPGTGDPATRGYRPNNDTELALRLPASRRAVGYWLRVSGMLTSDLGLTASTFMRDSSARSPAPGFGASCPGRSLPARNGSAAGWPGRGTRTITISYFAVIVTVVTLLAVVLFFRHGLGGSDYTTRTGHGLQPAACNGYRSCAASKYADARIADSARICCDPRSAVWRFILASWV
jgi:hypothetical protein